MLKSVIDIHASFAAALEGVRRILSTGAKEAWESRKISLQYAGDAIIKWIMDRQPNFTG